MGFHNALTVMSSAGMEEGTEGSQFRKAQPVFEGAAGTDTGEPYS